MVNSLPVSAIYTIIPATPTFDTTTTFPEVFIASTPGAAIYYTTDGSTVPDANVGTLYTGPFILASGTNTTIQAVAISSGSTSALATIPYTAP